MIFRIHGEFLVYLSREFICSVLKNMFTAIIFIIISIFQGIDVCHVIYMI